jgi:hydroxypyruvate isomerase
LKLAAASVLGAKLLGGSPLLAAPPASGVRFSFMLWALQQQAPFDRCIEIVAEAGYQGIELVGEFQHWSPEMRRQILARLQSLGLVIDAMSGVQAGFAVPQQTSAFLTQFADHLRSARELGCSRVILLSGARVPGMLPEAQRALAVDNLKQAAAMASKQAVEIVIEPIDLLEQPTIFLASVTDAFEIAHAVGAPNLKVLYDLYHEQRSFGNLIEKLEKNIDLVGLIHVADVPGRHQPGTGEIDYANIFRKLAALKYNRWIAMEYYPTGDPVKTLRNSRMEAAAIFAS